MIKPDELIHLGCSIDCIQNDMFLALILIGLTQPLLCCVAIKYTEWYVDKKLDQLEEVDEEWQRKKQLLRSSESSAPPLPW